MFSQEPIADRRSLTYHALRVQAVSIVNRQMDFLPQNALDFWRDSWDRAGFEEIGRLTPKKRLSRPSGDGFRDHGLQHFLVHILKPLDVKAALASGVLAEFSQQRFRIA